MQEGVPALTDILVDRSISKKELSLYCRRRTRGEEATIRLERLLQELRRANGRDLMGVARLDEVRMEHIWRVQKRYVRCIQNMPSVPLYTEVGTTTKGRGHPDQVPLCQRVHIPGVFPLPPKQVHSRNQCKCTELSAVPAGRLE